MVHSQLIEKSHFSPYFLLFLPGVREFHLGYVFSHVLRLEDLALRYYFSGKGLGHTEICKQVMKK